MSQFLTFDENCYFSAIIGENDMGFSVLPVIKNVLQNQVNVKGQGHDLFVIDAIYSSISVFIADIGMEFSLLSLSCYFLRNNVMVKVQGHVPVFDL